MKDRSSRLRVLFLTPYMKRGGSQSFIASLLSEMDRSVFAPELATMFDRDIEYAIPEDVRVWDMSECETSAHPIPLDWPTAVEKTMQSDIAWIEWKVGEIAALVRQVDPDVVFCSPEWASVLAAAASPGFPRHTRLICRIDAPPSMAFPDVGTDRLLGILARTHLNRADRLAAVSPAIVRELTDSYGVESGRIVRVHNSVDVARAIALGAEPVDEVAFHDGVPSVVFVGRVERVKGLRYLLAAMAAVIGEMPARLVIVGEGTQCGYLVALAKHLGIESQIVFVGAQANPFRFMSKATVFVLPSLSEGMPTVLVEAMACGCPVIATDIAGGAVRELLDDGESGLIVARASEQELAAAILRLLQSADARTRLVGAGRDRAAEFDLPRAVSENEELIHSVMQEQADVRDRSGLAHGGATAPRLGYSASLAASARQTRRRADRTLLNVLSVLRSQGSRAVWSRAMQRLQRKWPTVGALVPGVRAQRRKAARSAGLRADGLIHVTVLVPSLEDPTIGTGTESVLRHLDRAVFSVTLVTMTDERDPAGLPTDVDRFVVQARATGWPVGDCRLPSAFVAEYSEGIEWTSSMARGLAELARGLATDVILAQGYHASILASMAMNSLPPTTAVVAAVHTHTKEFASAWEGGQFYEALLRAYLPLADRLLAPDESIRSDLADGMSIAAERIEITPDPVEVCVVESEGREAHRTTLGGMIPSAWLGNDLPLFECHAGTSEDAELLMRAVGLASEQAEVRCVLFSDSVSAARESASLLGITDSLALGQKGEKVGIPDRAALVWCDALFVPGVPSEIIQAASAGCPSIVVAAPEAVSVFLGEGSRGSLVPGNDAEALAEAMLRVVWDESYRRTIAQSARVYLESVSAQTAVARIGEILEASVAAKRATAR